MRLVEEYRQRAEECRVLARQAISEDHRKLMIGMADIWEIMARQRATALRKTQSRTDPPVLPWRVLAAG